MFFISPLSINNKFIFYGVNPEWRKATLPSEHMLLIKNNDKLPVMCDEFEKFCTKFNYQLIHFIANDILGNAIYHTNVVMSVTSDFIIICKECIPNKLELTEILASTKKQIIEISLAQLNQFAGNVLEVLGTDNKKYLVMSEQAFKAYTLAQIKAFETHYTILHSPLYTIETNGGGSDRCMIAEVFLKLKDKK